MAKKQINSNSNKYFKIAIMHLNYMYMTTNSPVFDIDLLTGVPPIVDFPGRH